jgi:hypothetical protein
VIELVPVLRGEDAVPSGASRGGWSLAALALAVAGVIASAWLVFSVDSDPAGVAWPLVVAPVGIALAPVLVSGTAARIGAMLAMGGWCVLGGFSVGLLLVPSLAALVVLVLREVK